MTNKKALTGDANTVCWLK